MYCQNLWRDLTHRLVCLIVLVSRVDRIPEIDTIDLTELNAKYEMMLKEFIVNSKIPSSWLKGLGYRRPDEIVELNKKLWDKKERTAFLQDLFKFAADLQTDRLNLFHFGYFSPDLDDTRAPEELWLRDLQDSIELGIAHFKAFWKIADKYKEIK
jgi:hypothetical protein